MTSRAMGESGGVFVEKGIELETGEQGWRQGKILWCGKHNGPK